MRRALKLAAVLAAVAASAAYLLRTVQRPFGAYTGEVVIDIPKGMRSADMASRLAASGVIEQPWQFLAVRVLRPRAKLQAGEYVFRQPASVWQVFDRIVRGDIRYYELRVPEGSNLFEVARLVAALGLATEDEFRAAASDPSLLRDLAPQAVSLEGYLFPATYWVTKSTSPTELCRMMTNQFRQVWEKLGAIDSVHEVVTLASLVEEETGVAEERGIVASVFRNRLRQGIRLACDPTAIYAARLEGRYRGVIYRSDLDRRHPYNTYQSPGLPPGPISSPGLASLQAALHPATTNYLFFVAMPEGEGRHQFSATLAQHERAVAAYRRGIQRTTQANPPRPVPGRAKAGRG